MNFKDINIGSIIKQKVVESDMEMNRMCNFLKLNVNEVNETFDAESLDTKLLLRWSKLLEYDFFRLYSQHLILYSPPISSQNQHKEKRTYLPQFRKNIYTKELIDFILEQIDSKEMTRNEVMDKYKIPKTTLYKWIEKYNKE